ncbi:MAG TPA: helix-turn-helix transcriptional regulator [Actinophytocola sp.]|uniref:helix-turn-helix transcriptional regulator n=1 Tax=Actinophytocola sp. TaxID=1872138 RepID=UPI002DBF8D33|nr:helix-turn-helix transcriptional regulator [Actinophytocola sp.]HEU5475834.1 helix-turn-helix transcriptional regulator [Actinophytocola sp.]
MSDPWSLSENLARIRKARDLSQEQLAAAAGVAVDTVARIERAERRTTRPSTVHKLAGALGVTPSVLLGIQQPVGTVRVDVGDLRRAVTATEHIAGLVEFTERAEVIPVEVLTDMARRAWQAYVDGRHAELLCVLPPLLIDILRFAHSHQGDDRAAAHRVQSAAYRLAAGVAGRFDLDDLAWTAAERAVQAAGSSDAPDLQTAISVRYLVWTLVRQGRAEEAEQVAVKAAERVEPGLLDPEQHRVGVFGNLMFNAAAAAIRSGNGGRAGDLLAVAQSAAVRFGRDHSSEAAIFGPRVAAFQAVEQAVRLGDSEAALRLAERTPTTRGEVPAFWEAGHRLMLAAASADLRADRRAPAYLAEARAIAPEWVRYQPLGAGTMRILADRATRRRGLLFAVLATHYGVI